MADGTFLIRSSNGMCGRAVDKDHFRLEIPTFLGHIELFVVLDIRVFLLFS